MLLKDKYWEVNGGVMMGPAGRVTSLDTAQIDTTRTRRDLNHSNKRPETIALISLWGYISVLERTGLPSLGHESILLQAGAAVRVDRHGHDAGASPSSLPAGDAQRI